MYNGILTVCESCASPLEGKHKAANVAKNYLVLTGNLAQCEQHPDGETNAQGRTSWLYWLRKKNDFGQMHFCDFGCLQAFLEAKIYMVKEYQNKGRDALGESFNGYGDYREDE